MKNLLLILDALLCLASLFINNAKSLRITDFIVPKRVREGSDVLLTCKYDLEGASLYQLKWYRNETEFFRYEPKARDAFKHMYLPVKGITVNRQSNATHVSLKSVNKLTSGSFACEVSTDESFQTKHVEGRMLVDGAASKAAVVGQLQLLGSLLCSLEMLFLFTFHSYFYS